MTSNRVKGAEKVLPELVRTARVIHKTEAEIRTAVLLSWTGLAGIVGWTPRMVDAVERAMRVAAVLVVALAVSGSAGMAAVTVAETAVRGAGGKLAQGEIRIQATVGFTASSGVRVEPVEVRVPVRNGRFSVSVEANPTDTSYLVIWQLDGAPKRTTYWVVPAATTTLGVTDVEAQLKGPGLNPEMTWGNAVGTWGRQ